MRIAILLLILLAFVLGASTGIALPRCHEDAVLVGTGDFVNGHWTGYACGPAADDYIAQVE